MLDGCRTCLRNKLFHVLVFKSKIFHMHCTFSYATSTAKTNQLIESICFLVVRFLSQPELFIFLSVTQFFCSSFYTHQGGHEDKNRKRLHAILHPSPPFLRPSSSPFCPPSHSRLTQFPLFYFSFHVEDKPSLAVPVLEAKILLISVFF